MTTPLHPCPFVERAAELLPTLRDVLIHRAEEGRAKYGQYLSANPRTERKKVVHQLQEDLDGLLYELWREKPSYWRVEMRLMLIQDLLSRYPDLTFKEGYSGRGA